MQLLLLLAMASILYIYLSLVGRPVPVQREVDAAVAAVLVRERQTSP